MEKTDCKEKVNIKDSYIFASFGESLIWHFVLKQKMTDELMRFFCHNFQEGADLIYPKLYSYPMDLILLIQKYKYLRGSLF